MKEECECIHCGKTYYNTRECQTWLLCEPCMDGWWVLGCPIDE
jgi:hypothetical protein